MTSSGAPCACESVTAETARFTLPPRRRRLSGVGAASVLLSSTASGMVLSGSSTTESVYWPGCSAGGMATEYDWLALPLAATMSRLRRPSETGAPVAPPSERGVSVVSYRIDVAGVAPSLRSTKLTMTVVLVPRVTALGVKVSASGRRSGSCAASCDEHASAPRTPSNKKRRCVIDAPPKRPIPWPNSDELRRILTSPPAGTPGHRRLGATLRPHLAQGVPLGLKRRKTLALPVDRGSQGASRFAA